MTCKLPYTQFCEMVNEMLKHEVNGYKEENAELKDSLKEKREQIESLRDDLKEKTTVLLEKENEIAELKAQMMELKSQIGDFDKESNQSEAAVWNQRLRDENHQLKNQMEQMTRERLDLRKLLESDSKTTLKCPKIHAPAK